MCLFYDMTKAFDLLWHKVLFKKLKIIDVTHGVALQWIAPNLKYRHQVDSIKHTSDDGLTRQYQSSVGSTYISS